ncbi:hypothetical protein FLX56_20600 [Synechococcus moorigangaii CMS01]|nr:hypothetical protein [Synechococcus moorigangaii CMS01]
MKSETPGFPATVLWGLLWRVGKLANAEGILKTVFIGRINIPNKITQIDIFLKSDLNQTGADFLLYPQRSRFLNRSRWQVV